MLFIPEAFDPLTDTTNYPLTRILYSLYLPKCMLYIFFQKAFVHLTVKRGYSSSNTVIVQELFSSGINLIITEQQCTNKFNNEIFKVKSVIRENNILLCSDQFYHQTCQIFFIFISGAKGLPTISNYWSNVKNCIFLSPFFALPCLINLCTSYLLHWFWYYFDNNTPNNQGNVFSIP